MIDIEEFKTRWAKVDTMLSLSIEHQRCDGPHAAIYERVRDDVPAILTELSDERALGDAYMRLESHMLAHHPNEQSCDGDAVEAAIRVIKRESGRAEQAFRDVDAGLARERQMREQLATVATGTNGVWRWMGDGHDDPESLTCPVVMSADTLRAMLAKVDEAKQMRGLADAERTLRMAEVRYERMAWGADDRKKRRDDYLQARQAYRVTVMGQEWADHIAAAEREAEVLWQAAQAAFRKYDDLQCTCTDEETTAHANWLAAEAAKRDAEAKVRRMEEELRVAVEARVGAGGTHG